MHSYLELAIQTWSVCECRGRIFQMHNTQQTPLYSNLVHCAPININLRPQCPNTLYDNVRYTTHNRMKKSTSTYKVIQSVANTIAAWPGVQDAGVSPVSAHPSASNHHPHSDAYSRACAAHRPRLSPTWVLPYRFWASQTNKGRATVA